MVEDRNGEVRHGGAWLKTEMVNMVKSDMVGHGEDRNGEHCGHGGHGGR